MEAVPQAPIDYIGLGPDYGTRTQETGLPDLGLVRLREICAESPFPVVGIGGIGMGNYQRVLDAGAQGLAVLGAFCLAEDPEAFARELWEAVQC